VKYTKILRRWSAKDAFNGYKPLSARFGVSQILPLTFLSRGKKNKEHDNYDGY